MLSKESSPM